MRPTRRAFLGDICTTGLAVAFGSFLTRLSVAGTAHRIAGYGPLSPVADETTGLPLLALPDGFRYRSYGWTQDPLADGTPTPGVHDGMGMVSADEGVLTMVRNHEISEPCGPFGRHSQPYDRRAGGGCVTLRFNADTGEWMDSHVSLTGTVKNCAGGETPWGTWLTCEETVVGPAVGDAAGFEQTHGWIFEVGSDATRPPVPLKDMGRFKHEAVAVDTQTGIVYETEDQGVAGFYRFLPRQPGVLQDGGRLQMMKVAGRDDLRRGVKVGQTFDVSWVDIEDPQRAHSPESVASGGDGDELGVFLQGKAQGGVTFARLEGCFYRNDAVYLDSTNGGDQQVGQIWQYDPRNEQLKLIFESPSAEILDSPDNLTVSPRGGIVLCEDGDVLPHRVHGLTPDGRIFPFCENRVQLSGEKNGFRGDFRDQEWAGATFSPDGRWLFVNVQNPGFTVAITGPWGAGLL